MNNFHIDSAVTSCPIQWWQRFELALLPVVRAAGLPTAKVGHSRADETGGDVATSARTLCVGHVRDDNDIREHIPARILVSPSGIAPAPGPLCIALPLMLVSHLLVQCLFLGCSFQGRKFWGNTAVHSGRFLATGSSRFSGVNSKVGWGPWEKAHPPGFDLQPIIKSHKGRSVTVVLGMKRTRVKHPI